MTLNYTLMKDEPQHFFMKIHICLYLGYTVSFGEGIDSSSGGVLGMTLNYIQIFYPIIILCDMDKT